MARPNYGAVKRTKELKRKAKREAKLARKHARKAREDEAAGGSTGPLSPGSESAPDVAPGDPGPRPGGG